MIKGKGTKKPYVQFLGYSSVEVTQSCYLLRFQKYCLLLDCGMYQGADLATNYNNNKELLKKIKAKEIDYICLHEVHIDHTGLVPALYAQGCQAHIYVPKGSTPFLKLLWEDSMKIMEQDCLKLQKKTNTKAVSFYSEKDIENALNRIIEIDFHKNYFINPYMKLTYYHSGHIINSAQTMLELYEGNIIKRLAYTGDIGGAVQRPYTQAREYIGFADLVICENTYNSPQRVNKVGDRARDIEKIHSIVDEYNKIIFPAFSLQRTQELLKVLYEEKVYEKVKIYLDSPLAQKFCEIWPKTQEWESIYSTCHKINSWEESCQLQESNEHCIIIAASGFLNGGRVLSHLKTLLPSPKNHVVFIGFAGTNVDGLPYQIKHPEFTTVKIDGEFIPNRANFTELVSFSSHASYEELMDYYSTIRYNKMALVHGNFENKVEFANVLRDKLIEQGNSARVIAVNKDTKIYV